MANLKIEFSPDGKSCKIVKPVDNAPCDMVMNLNEEQIFQLYDEIQLNYYRGEVKDQIQNRVDDQQIDADTAGELLVDKKFVQRCACVYQENVRGSDGICQTEAECLEDAVDQILKERCEEERE